MPCSFVKSWLPAHRIAVVAAAILWAAPSSQAALIFDGDVTSNVIVGTDVDNGAFTVARASGVELGLRGKLRFNASNNAENTFNSNGDGSYTFLSGQPVGGGFGFAPYSASTPVWSFDWSINSDFDGSGVDLDDLTYRLDIDFDPTAGQNFLSFDLINGIDPAKGVQWYDHAIGTNATARGAGVSATDQTTYDALIASNNLAQNSWNMEFFDDAGGGYPFNANVNGTYDIVLTAFSADGLTQLAQTQITVHAVPEPASLLTLAGLGLCASIGVRRKRRRVALQA